MMPRPWRSRSASASRIWNQCGCRPGVSPVRLAGMINSESIYALRHKKLKSYPEVLTSGASEAKRWQVAGVGPRDTLRNELVVAAFAPYKTAARLMLAACFNHVAN